MGWVVVAIFGQDNVPQNVDDLEQYLVHGDCSVCISYHLLDSKPDDPKMGHLTTSYPSLASEESFGESYS